MLPVPIRFTTALLYLAILLSHSIPGECCDINSLDCFVQVGEKCAENGKVFSRCPPYAECKYKFSTKLGFCECNIQSFYKNSEGLCSPKGTIGENCTSDIQCRNHCVQGKCARSSASFGDPCGADTRCDPRPQSFLTCVGDTCHCSNTTTFDKDEGKCVVLVNQKCADSVGRRADCVDNSYCGGSTAFICQCVNEKEFYENGEGFCIPKKVLGGTCSSDVECRGDLFLSCVGESCQCKDPHKPNADGGCS